MCKAVEEILYSGEWRASWKIIAIKPVYLKVYMSGKLKKKPNEEIKIQFLKKLRFRILENYTLIMTWFNGSSFANLPFTLAYTLFNSCNLRLVGLMLRGLFGKRFYWQVFRNNLLNITFKRWTRKPVGKITKYHGNFIFYCTRSYNQMENMYSLFYRFQVSLTLRVIEFISIESNWYNNITYQLYCSLLTNAIKVILLLLSNCIHAIACVWTVSY